MILTLPSASSADVGHRTRGSTSYILHESAQQYEGAGVGSLSIKTFFGGQALYEVGDGRFAVNDRSYFILNHGQPYAITIESETAVESFCIFFESGFAENVRRSLVTSMNRLLDMPELPATPDLHFFEQTYPHDAVLSPALFTLRTALSRGIVEQGWLEEQFHGLIQRLLHVHQRVYREVEAVPAARAATREELYRRLQRAREYAAASFTGPITLADLAHVASLSPNHLLRMFRQVFHETPHQYVTSLRLEHAQRLLRETELPVTDICFAVGFESVGSFSWLFRRRFGVAPSVFRCQNG